MQPVMWAVYTEEVTLHLVVTLEGWELELAFQLCPMKRESKGKFKHLGVLLMIFIYEFKLDLLVYLQREKFGSILIQVMNQKFQ